MPTHTVAVEVHYTDGRVVPANYRSDSLLETLQGIVGGDVERVVLDDGKVALVNEDGRPLKLPVNRSMPCFVGNVVVMDDADLD